MLDRIESMLAVMAEGSVNKAAKRLGIAQPTLSRHIQSLEAEIGGALFERDASGMRPTSLGFFVRDQFEPIVKSCELAHAEVTAFAQGRHQQLRVGYIGSAAHRFLNPALAELRNKFSDLKLMLFSLTPMEQLEALRAGRIDVAIVGQEMVPLAEDFYQRKAATLGICAALPVDHASAGQPAIALNALSGDRFIGVDGSIVPGRNEWIIQLCAKAGFTPVFAAKTQDIAETFTRIAAEGAVALLPDYFTGQPPPGIIFVRISDKWARWHLIVLRQRGRGLAAARELVELLTAKR
jgi:DNA-binding transcriptional LysR family regulator